jgi:hypothetical protein
LIPIFVGHELKRYQRARAKITATLQWGDGRLYGVAEKVSLWSTAQQLHHSAMVATFGFDTIQKLHEEADSTILRRGFPTRNGIAVLLLGKIPRGKVKAPEAVQSPPEVTRPVIEKALAAADLSFDRVLTISPFLHDLKGRWTHPALGALNAPEWFRFVRVHTDHHLAIVDDIAKALG